MRDAVFRYARDLVIVALFVVIMLRSDRVLDAVKRQAELAAIDRGDVVVSLKHPLSGADIQHRIVRLAEHDTPEKWATYVVRETLEFEAALRGK